MEPVQGLSIQDNCAAIPVGEKKLFVASVQTGKPVQFLWTFDLHRLSKATHIGKEVRSRRRWVQFTEHKRGLNRLFSVISRWGNEVNITPLSSLCPTGERTASSHLISHNRAHAWQCLPQFYKMPPAFKYEIRSAGCTLVMSHPIKFPKMSRTCDRNRGGLMLIQSSKAGFDPGFVPDRAEKKPRLSPRERKEPQKKAFVCRWDGKPGLNPALEDWICTYLS